MNENPLSFPREADQQRLARYEHFDKLYKGNHYDAYLKAGGKNVARQYERLKYIAANFAGLMSRTLADVLFGENLVVDVNPDDKQDDPNQLFVDALMEQNQLITQLYESELVNSRKGDDVFKIRSGQRNPLVTDSPNEVIIEQIGPNNYFPEFDASSGRNNAYRDILMMKFNQGKDVYYHKEIHIPGEIIHEIWSYDENAKRLGAQHDPKDFGYQEMEQTGINRSLIFHTPNVRDGSGFWGTSDYSDLDSLFYAINNRLTKSDAAIDKHGDPLLAVPPGVIDENGQVHKSDMGLIEVDNETPGFNKPEYIVWDAKLEAAWMELDKLLSILFAVSEIAPALFGMDKDGKIESGRALKFKLLTTIRKRNRKRLYYDQTIKDMIQTSQEFALANNLTVNGQKPQDVIRPTVKWSDGIVNDETEQVDIAVKRIDAGLSSAADEIAKLDGLTPDEAQAKADKIRENIEPRIPIELDESGNGEVQ